MNQYTRNAAGIADAGHRFGVQQGLFSKVQKLHRSHYHNHAYDAHKNDLQGALIDKTVHSFSKLSLNIPAINPYPTPGISSLPNPTC